MAIAERDKPPLHPGDELVEYLSFLELEMRRAMRSIAENDVAGLEQSLREQETLCSQLNLLLGTGGAALSPTAMQKVHLATNSARDLSRSYLLLVEHAGANAEQLRRLCRTYIV